MGAAESFHEHLGFHHGIEEQCVIPRCPPPAGPGLPADRPSLYLADISSLFSPSGCLSFATTIRRSTMRSTKVRAAKSRR